MHYVICMLAN